MHDNFLKYFDEVARQGSIRKAAGALNLSATTVNRKILNTENRLGVRLLHRSAGGISLTNAGSVVLEHCRKTLFDFDRINLVIDDIRDLRTGHVSIMALDSIALGVMPDVIGPFTNTYPEVTFSVSTGEPYEIPKAVVDGVIDIGLAFWQDRLPDIRTVAEKSTPIGAIMLPNHPLAERDKLAFEDIAGFPTIRSIDGRGSNSIIDEVMSDNAASILTSVFTNSLPLAKQMILQGKGIGLYTKIGFLEEIDAKALRYVPIVMGGLEELKIAVMVSSRVPLSPIKHLACNEIIKGLRAVRLD